MKHKKLSIAPGVANTLTLHIKIRILTTTCKLKHIKTEFSTAA